MTLSSTAVERAIAQCTSRWAMARGHRLNTSIVLAAVHGLSGLFRAVSAVEPITLALFPTLSPSLIGHPASVDVKQHKSQASSFTSIGSVICSVTALWCHQYPHPYRAPSCRKAYSRHTKFHLDSFRWSNAKLFTALTETDRQWLFFIYRILQPFFEWCAVFTLPSHFPVFC